MGQKENGKTAVVGLIKNNKLIGLYHSKDYCTRLQQEIRLYGGEVHTINRKVSKTNRFYCRTCIYLEAEEQDINCWTICPHKTCLTKETLPLELKMEIENEHKTLWYGDVFTLQDR